MSVTVTDTPYIISWARNKNVLTLLCDIGTKRNYAIAAKVSVWVNNYNAIREYQSEVMVFHPDEENYVRIPLDLLSGYTPQPDLPDGQAFSLLTNAVLKYRIGYAEMYGDTTPIVRVWRYDQYRFAVCGEVAERYARLNMPDWHSGMVRVFRNSPDLFWVIGEDTNKTVNVHRSQSVYLYGLWYWSISNVELLEVRVVVSSPSLDNDRVLTYTAMNGSMYRIDVSPETLQLASDCLRYSVRVVSSGGSWSRTYNILPDGYKDTQFLLQNKYGVLAPWVCPEVKREITTTAENVRVGRMHYADQTDSYEKYTAKFPMMATADAARLARCIGQRYHYIKSGFAWLRIVIEPDSYTVKDEPENMVRVSFAFRFVENQLENISDAPRTAGMSFNFDDAERERVAFSDRTIPINNELI